MKLVFLETDSLGDDMDLGSFARYGQLEQYHFSTLQETKERVRERMWYFPTRFDG